MPRLTLEPDEPLRVLVPSTAIGEAVEALSPRVRAYRVNAEDGPPAGDAALAQVWVPRSAGAFLPDGFLDGLPRLRLVQLLSAGAERFVGRLPEGVFLCNARGAHTPSTAEWAVAATLAAQRGIPFFVREQDAGRWSSATFHSLVGARVLVVGAGDIGTTIGRMLAGFDVQPTYVARTARDGVRSTADLPQLLPRADVVIVIVPVTPETTGMVDAVFLAAMPDGALVVNVARGKVVDTAALVEATATGRIMAAVDVTDPEPLPDGHPLWRRPGVLITPHVGGDTSAFAPRAARLVRQQLTALVRGEPLRNLVNGS